jgi:hypothetical protein
VAGRYGGSNQSGCRRARTFAVAPQQTQSRTQRCRIDIRRVLEPPLADAYQRSAQLRRRHGQKRTQQSEARRLNERRHTGHAGWTAVAKRADLQGLCLVARMMSEQQMQYTRFGARRFQRREAGVPSSLGDRGAGAKTLDDQNSCRDASLTKARYRLRRLFARLSTEAVIDHQRLQRSAALPCPGVGQQSQTHAIGTA